MDKVYFVITSYPYDGDQWWGCFSSKEKAEERLNSIKLQYGQSAQIVDIDIDKNMEGI